MKIYHTVTQEDYDTLMIELEEKGYKWLSGYKPTSKDYWNEENSCIKISGKNITFGSIEQHKKEYPGTPIIKYKAKGENMLNTECKQCHKKWHHDNAKYCSMCGNKLIEEPEFKVGDYVVEYDNYITKIDEIDECGYLIGRTYGVDVQTLAISKNYVRSKTARIATPEEIAEYEAALTFHKHGREPFDVKDGDLLENVFGKYIAHKSLFVKEDFTVGGNTFLKTVEEVNEWLGADDE